MSGGSGFSLLRQLLALTDGWFGQCDANHGSPFEAASYCIIKSIHVMRQETLANDS